MRRFSIAITLLVTGAVAIPALSQTTETPAYRGRCYKGQFVYVRTYIASIEELPNSVVVTVTYRDTDFVLKKTTPGFETSLEALRAADRSNVPIYLTANDSTREALKITLAPEPFCD